MQQKRRIKNIDEVIRYLNSINYYANKTEENVKTILKDNIAKYKQGKITVSFLVALCSELLYYANNIGAFKDTALREVLEKGDRLSYQVTFQIKNSESDSLLDSILTYCESC